MNFLIRNVKIITAGTLVRPAQGPSNVQCFVCGSLFQRSGICLLVFNGHSVALCALKELESEMLCDGHRIMS